MLNTVSKVILHGVRQFYPGQQLISVMVEATALNATLPTAHSEEPSSQPKLTPLPRSYTRERGICGSDTFQCRVVPGQAGKLSAVNRSGLLWLAAS